MTTLLQMNQEDLRTAFKSFFIESIEEIKRIPTPAPLPDRISLSEACELTNQSKSQIYKLTMLNEIPFQKYGKRLIFSRRSLLSWMEERTISSHNSSEEITERLSKTARKRLVK